MKIIQFFGLFLSRFAFLLGVFISLTLVGCFGSSGGGGSSGNGGSTETADLGTTVKNVALTSGVPVEITFTYTIPGDITAKGDFTGNLTETLSNMSLTASPVASNDYRLETLWMIARFLINDAFAAPEDALVSVYISFPGDPNVCSSSTMIGPFTITGEIGSALTSATTSVSPTEPIINIVNTGSFEVCIVTTPPINAFLTITGVAVDFEDCEPPTVTIADTNWSGTYQCTNFGIPDEGGSVSLYISENLDGSYHYIDGSGAEYDGHLCGNTFKFNGGLAGDYTESGTLTFSSNTMASKSSHWNSDPAGASGGDCTDDLQRV